MYVSKAHRLEIKVGVLGLASGRLSWAGPKVTEADKNQADPPNKVEKNDIQGHKDTVALWCWHKWRYTC